MNFATWKMAYRLLDRTERRQALVALTVAVLSALASGAMVASVMPFLSVLANPSLIHSDERLQALYDYAGFTSDYRFLAALGGASLLVIALATLVQLFRVYYLSHFSLMRMHHLSCRLLEQYLRQPYAFFRDRHTGEMGTQILNETQQIVTQFYRPACNIIAAVFSILVLVGLLLWVHPWVTLVSFAVFLGVYGATYVLIKRRLSRLGSLRAESNKTRFKIANEALSGIKDITLVGAERAYLQRYSMPSLAMARAQVVASVLGEMPSFVLQGFALGGSIVLGLMLLDPVALSGGSALAELLPLLGVFAFAGLRMIPELQRLYLGLTQAQFAAPAVRAIYEDMFALKQGKDLPLTHATSMTLREGVTLENVTYRFAPNEEAGISDISMQIAAGSKVGIVGTTGAGKTTLADTLLGLNLPQSGHIRVDGLAIDEKNLRSWQRSIGYVPQDIFLVDGTIAENVALGELPDAIDMARVKEACRIANLSRFIEEEMNDGFRSLVGERGIKLSGGQRQRVGIARALYHEASLLLFDEATSALDNETEQEVMKAINALPGDKTIVMIAHRLSTLRACDKIVVLDKGRIVGEGSWQELLESNAIFRRLAEAAHG